MMAALLQLDPAGADSLADLLFQHGVEFPCGGASLCGGCKVRVVAGDVPVTPEMADALSPEELAAGWRLGCLAHARGPVTLEIEQWSMPVLTDEAALPFEPAEGLGVAIDVGSTTIVAQLLDLSTGTVRGVRTALNPQSRHGADIMSRIEFELRQPGVLGRLIRNAIGEIVADLLAGREAREILLAGNTVMHHLFAGFDVEPLSHVPFQAGEEGAFVAEARQLGWAAGDGCRVEFLPCLGCFVGSDILAGIVSSGMHGSDEAACLMDLGTNGEIAIGGRGGILCASTAAGPAFEAGRIRMGMRAQAGAIDRVVIRNGGYSCHVIGGGSPRGICGSGVVDAAAAGLGLGLLSSGGRLLSGSREWLLMDPVRLAQADIRELQLAKAAIAAGTRILAARWGSAPERIWLAGAFGNYVNISSARRIGLLPAAIPAEPSGNTALRGVKMLLLAPSRRAAIVDAVRESTTHVALAADPRFEDLFVENMGFAAPDTSGHEEVNR